MSRLRRTGLLFIMLLFWILMLICHCKYNFLLMQQITTSIRHNAQQDWLCIKHCSGLFSYHPYIFSFSTYEGWNVWPRLSLAHKYRNDATWGSYLQLNAITETIEYLFNVETYSMFNTDSLFHILLGPGFKQPQIVWRDGIVSRKW